MSKIKVGIVGTNGLPGKYGGWDQLVIHLTDNLREKFDFLVYTSSFNTEPDLKEYNGTKLKIIKLKANGIQSIIYDFVSMLHAGFNCDVMFICGTSGCIFLPLIRLFNKKIILNPDGLEWKRKKWSKPVKWFLKYSESVGVRYADCVVADNKKIVEYISKEYRISSQLIEYGGDHVLKNIKLSESASVKYSIEANNYAFKVCRIEPENNIHIILEAFKSSNIKLIIIGNWNYSSYGKNLRSTFINCHNIQMLDPIYDQIILDEIRSNCLLYIHGHSVGGTNPSLVEAMHLSLPIIAYNSPFNIETTEGSAYYFSDSVELKDIIKRVYNKEIDTSLCSNKMLSIAEGRYVWEKITDKYADLFKIIKG